MSLKSETNEMYLYTETICLCLIPMTEVIFNHGSEIWGFHNGKDVEKVQLQKRTTNCVVVYCETGRFPMKVARLFRIFTF